MARLAHFLTILCAVTVFGRAVEGAGFTDIQAIGLPVDVRAVVVDRLGFVWTAGARGVCRFDGSDWFCPEERPARTLSVDDGNCLWAGLADQSVVALHAAGRVPHITGRASEQINGVVQTRGTLWLATDKGLYSAATNLTPISFRRVVEGPVRQLLVQRSGVPAAGVGPRLLAFDGHNQAITLATLGSAVSAISLSVNGNAVLVGTDTGALYRIGPRQVTKLPLRNDGSRIVSVSEDAANHVWAGTSGHLHRFDLETGETVDFNDAPGLPHNLVTAIAFDGAARLWLGTPAGLAQMRLGYPVRSLTRTFGLLTDVAFAVTGDRDGTIWSATGPGVAAWRQGWIQSFGPLEGLTNYDSRTIAIDPQNKVWIGGLTTGLYAVEGKQAVKKWPRDPNAHDGIRALRPRNKGGLWVGLNNGGLARFTDGKLVPEFPPSAPGNDLVFDLVEDPGSGGVWLALSHAGLAFYGDGRLTRFSSAPGLPKAEVLALALTDAATLWIGTNGGGLVRLNGDRFHTVNAAQGLLDDHIYGLVSDGERLWMSSPLAVGAASLKNLNAVADAKQTRLEMVTFGMTDGLPGEPIRGYPPSAFRASDGSVWFPTLRGLVNIDPKAIRSTADPVQPITIDDVEINGRSIVADKKSVAPSLRSEVLFKFAGPEFSVSRQLGFRYKLEGLEPPADVWHTIQHGKEARYQSVPPGHYKFRVQRIAKMPRAVAETDFAFSLSKPWHATFAFRGSMVVLMLLLFVVAHKKRIQRIEQTHEVVLSERARIARDIHDSLQQDLSGLRLQIDAAAMVMKSDPLRAEDHLARASELITDGVIDLRNTIWGLQSSKASTSEIVEAVRTRLYRLTAGTSLQADVEHVGHPRNLAASDAMHVVHVAREAVTNVIKHAKATSIRLTVDTTKVAETLLLVEDDGVGTVVADTAGSVSLSYGQGLVSMKSRAAAVGGTLEVRPRPGGGTSVALRIPSTSGRRQSS